MSEQASVTRQSIDTAIYNYQRTTLPDGYSVAVGHLGNLGLPLFSKIFFDRKEKSQFVFYDAYDPYNKNPENQLFFQCTAFPIRASTIKWQEPRKIKKNGLKVA